MNPLSAVYGAVVATRNALYDRGVFRAERLQRPVVSVGNISVGGAGKTPFTMVLGELLKARGVAFDVLSRGYRRESTGVRVVDANGSGREFGDEPLLIARRLGVPVVVGEGRYEAGVAAEEKFATELHLLDDGFQHRQLARALDIVLVAADDLRAGLLPTGRLREPISSLGRADVLVVDEDFGQTVLPLRNGQAVWRVRRGMRVSGVSSRPVAFCGIARPQGFFSQLRKAGVEVAEEVTFRDHHRYSEADVRRLLTVAREKNADGFITTAKDEVNLDLLAQQLQPLAMAEVTMELADAEAALELIAARCGLGGRS